jgi:hypothetical protein
MLFLLLQALAGAIPAVLPPSITRHRAELPPSEFSILLSVGIELFFWTSWGFCAAWLWIPVHLGPRCVAAGCMR